jgi:hypothetical protein
MNLQYCLPLVQGRGAGLGNELVPWARAYLMSRVLGACCLRPAFGLNSRGYGIHFGSTRLDWLWHRIMARTLPCVHFDEADYLAHGGGDAAEAFASFSEANRLKERGPLVVVTGGIWGGIRHIERACGFVRGVMYGSKFAPRNLAELGARLDPAKLTVAMHVRLGDFVAAPASEDPNLYRGRFNVSMPIEWFVEIGLKLRAAFMDQVQFQVFSDGTPERLRPLVDALSPVPTVCPWPSDVSDLLAMSSADALVCSVSTYSVWAAALSDSPYIWFRPQLQPHSDDMWSIWGNEPAQSRPTGATSRALASQALLPAAERVGRAHSMAPGDPLPPLLVDDLERALCRRRRESDLVRYGVV